MREREAQCFRVSSRVRLARLLFTISPQMEKSLLAGYRDKFSSYKQGLTSELPKEGCATTGSRISPRILMSSQRPFRSSHLFQLNLQHKEPRL